MERERARATLHGDGLGKKGSDRGHVHSQNLAWRQLLSGLPPPPPRPFGVWSSLTWEEDALRFLLVREGVLDGADHIAYSAVCDQESHFHVEEPVSILGQ